MPILRFLYELGDISIEDIYPKITENASIAFGDLIPDFYNFDISKEPKLKMTREWIISGCHPDSLAYAIRNDDIQKVMEMMNEYHFNQIIEEPFLLRKFYRPTFKEFGIKWNPINAASFFGSVKCFKYFFLNGAIVDEQTMLAAVIGGFREIIRLLEQSGVPFGRSYYVASACFRYDLIDWFNEFTSVSEDINQTSMFGIFDTPDLNDKEAFDLGEELISKGTERKNIFLFRSTKGYFNLVIPKYIEELKNDQMIFENVIFKLSEEQAKLVLKSVPFRPAIEDIIGRRRRDIAQIVFEEDKSTGEELLKLIPDIVLEETDEKMVYRLPENITNEEIDTAIKALQKHPEKVEIDISYTTSWRFIYEMQNQITDFTSNASHPFVSCVLEEITNDVPTNAWKASQFDTGPFVSSFIAKCHQSI